MNTEIIKLKQRWNWRSAQHGLSLHRIDIASTYLHANQCNKPFDIDAFGVLARLCAVARENGLVVLRRFFSPFPLTLDVDVVATLSAAYIKMNKH